MLLRRLFICFLLSVVVKADDGKKWDYDNYFSGISTFAHLPTERCLVNTEETFDIAVIGIPFDTAVSYRPGARFGPRAIRAASSRQSKFRSFNPRAAINPYMDWAKVIDCGDMPITPFHNRLALDQMTLGLGELLNRSTESKYESSYLSLDSRVHPRLVTLGGDHSIALASLRALKDIYGPLHVIHFDAHLDTWVGDSYPTVGESNETEFTHGTMFWMAAREGLIKKGSCIHAGLRTRLSGTDYSDYQRDTSQGWHYIEAHEIDKIHVSGVLEKIKDVVGDGPVYVSLDIDVIDPGLAPGKYSTFCEIQHSN